MSRRKLRIAALFVAGFLPLVLAASAAQANGPWRPTGSMATNRGQEALVLLDNGLVLVAGGSDNDTVVASAELYDPATGSWSPTGSMAQARLNATATLLPDGDVLVAGGEGPDGAFDQLASAELYHPGTGTWSATGSMATARTAASATLLPDGKVLVASGLDTAGSFTASAELYYPVTGMWATTGSMHTARSDASAALLGDGKVLVAGGDDNPPGVPDGTAELYNPATGRWANTAPIPNGDRRDGAMSVLLPDGDVLVAGGGARDGLDLATAVRYHPDTGTWSSAATMPVPRSAGVADLLGNGEVLVAGGDGPNNTPHDMVLSSAELYDPVADVWSGAGHMNAPRLFPSSVVLPNGRVLVTGGFARKPGLTVASAETYRPMMARPHLDTLEPSAP